MKVQLRVLWGARTGAVEVHSTPEIKIGRHPASDLRFHPELDLDVSSHHALIVRSGNNWMVRDLQSRNGTLVNGHKVTGDTQLDDTDQIRFGADGPGVEFRRVPDSVADTPPATFEPATGSPPRASPSGPPTPASLTTPAPATARLSGTTQRIRLEVAKQTQKLRWVTTALLLVLVAAVAGFYVVNQRQERARAAEASAMRSRVDSIMRSADDAVRSLKGEVAGLADALRRSQTEVQRLQAHLASAQRSGDREQVAELSRQLSEASSVLRNQQAAAQVDYDAIYQTNQRAIGIIYVEFAPGEVFTGTAFAVNKNGLMVTNRHVILGKDGSGKPTRIGVQFADSRQNFPVQVLATSPDVDLAIVRVNVNGGVPTVKGLSSSADGHPGDPVAIIGFPLGVELPMLASKDERPAAKTTFTAGTISKVLPDLVQIDGYGAEGSSGSPIFDRKGDVIAILYGGQPGTSGRVVFAVPASYATRLLESIS